jgi:hypothetical protein
VPLKRTPPPRSRPITDHLLDRFCFLTARNPFLARICEFAMDSLPEGVNLNPERLARLQDCH